LFMDGMVSASRLLPASQSIVADHTGVSDSMIGLTGLA
jgi:hypothetical protein